MKVFLRITIVMVLLAAFTVTAVAAGSTASSMRLQSTQGTVTVKNAAGAKVSVSSGMRLNSGYKITTGKKSYAYISLDSTKTVKLDASSTAQVCKSGNKLEIRAVSGKLSVNVKAPVGKKAKTNVRTATMVTGVRGTYLDVNRSNNRINLPEGELFVRSRIPNTVGMEAKLITSGQAALVNSDLFGGSGNEVIQITDLDISAMPGFVAMEIAENSDLRIRLKEKTNLPVDQIVATARQRLIQEEEEADRLEADLKVRLREAGIIVEEPVVTSRGGNALPKMIVFSEGAYLGYGSEDDLEIWPVAYDKSLYEEYEEYMQYYDSESYVEEVALEKYNESLISDVRYEFSIDGRDFYPAVFVPATSGDGSDKYVVEGLDLSNMDAGAYEFYIRASAPGYATTVQQSLYVSISPKRLDNPTIELEYDKVFYNGEETVIPEVVAVKDDQKTVDPAEYTVNEATINDTQGVITISDKEGGNYTVSGMKTFEIVNPEDVLSITFGNSGECVVNMKVDSDADGTLDSYEPLDEEYYTVEKEITLDTDNLTTVSATVTAQTGAPIAGTGTIRIYSSDSDINIPYDLTNLEDEDGFKGITTALGYFDRVIINGTEVDASQGAII